MKTAILAILTFVSFTAVANQRPGLQTCRVMIVDKDLPQGAYEITYDVPEVARDGHGGEPVDIESGPHRVEVSVDGRWRNLVWFKGDSLVAKVITLNEKIYDTQHVVILANPQDDDEQLSLGCEPKR